MKDKVAIITGASSGIGLATAWELGRSGAFLVLASRSRDRLESIASSMSKEGIEVLVVPTDISSEEDCKKLVESCIRKYGKLDILINNAGISMRTGFLELHLDVIRQLMDVNFWGTVYCSKYALPHLLESRGSLVAISSVAGFIGLPGRAAYAASKSAIMTFMRSIKLEHFHDDLHVMVVAPGFTRSNIRLTALGPDAKPGNCTPMDEKKLMSPEYVAAKIKKGLLQRKELLIMTFLGKLVYYLARFLPNMANKKVVRDFSLKKDNSLH